MNITSPRVLEIVTAPYKIICSVEIGLRGHILVLAKSELNKAEMILANVYAPNGFDDEKLDFFETTLEELMNLKTIYNCDEVILAGDLNLVFAESEVSNRIITPAEKRIAGIV